MMKRFSIPITILLLFCFSSSFSQEKEIKLNLKEGYEYIFNTSEKYYGLKQDNTSNFYRVREKQLKITVEKFDADNEAIISVNYLQNSTESPYENHLINKFDLFYPNFSPEKNIGTQDVFERFLCKNGIRFSIDLQTREIKIIDREIVLEDFYLYLKNLGYQEKEIKSTIDYTNTRYLPVSEELVSHLVWFHKATIDKNGFIQNSLINEKLKINADGSKHVTFIDLEFDKLIPGKTHKKYWIDLGNGIITNYTSVKRDSTKRSLQARLRNVLWNVNKNKLQLISSKPIPKNALFVSGKIENPLSNNIHIRFLDKPFGVEMRTKTLVLDENNQFNTSMNLKTDVLFTSKMKTKTNTYHQKLMCFMPNRAIQSDLKPVETNSHGR